MESYFQNHQQLLLFIFICGFHGKLMDNAGDPVGNQSGNGADGDNLKLNIYNF